MNWKRAKSLFIVVFLLVNICLIFVYNDKISKSKISDAEQQNSVNFEQENIKLPKNMPDVSHVKMQLITARSKDFKDEAEKSGKIEARNNGHTLDKEMSESVNVKLDPISHLKPYIDQNIYKGNEYQYHDTSDGKIKYEQTYKGFPIMNNNRAELTFDVKDDTVKSYEQSAMEDILPSKGSNNEPRQVISAHKAIEALYYNQYLKHDQEVENIRLGYYTVVKETNIQVLQANWEIKVKDANGTHTYYVEAISSNPQIIEQ
ncbi:TPA: hypothetical protein I1691_001106 [Staphylococcus pseudintermedius]|uniref:two-component system regulatory protein YycI n=1 Tax=Staphylococcus pseudintermedius TaxID=283734 RepID=UPI001A0C82BA|nr:two-component system regulatory protein YycI [Staphylococcus pseudintermedius]EGQ2799201.1 hypothetical protein [Staphylococcus pseudintermedius]EGQ3522005.1 hypothetical protein [Staphylococcus pseudintermedius]EGQ3713537.1 hypothetical protein [Staphylococcus pseudintermedius]EGQ3956056.1 hypothetical protein [Staphylococcus pseudintermedius]EGQ3968986.1 hypothetical protein [Staphylococcus pseudintermedius]